ncbi:MAG TPA: response regulator [Planctomycetota bacterium]|nr:response regulator [Planctomycetota bacterium]
MNSGTHPGRPVVVVVDDDPETLRSLVRLLRKEAYELLSTPSPNQVLEWARTRRLDLVIADQRMPELSGTELLLLLRDLSPQTKGILLSGLPDTALIVESSGLRLERQIAKPWENRALQATVRDVLSKAARPAAPAAEVEGKLLEIRVDCAGREAGLVLAEILPACRRAPSGTRACITLDNVLLLEDSLARLLKDLARTVAWLEVPIEIRDRSGCVNAFLEALGEGHRVS